MENVVHTAKEIARVAHYGQFRRDGRTPYVNHADAVAAKVWITTNDTVATAVAYLHDVLEDTHFTEYTLQVIGFSQEVIDAVKILSKNYHGVDVDYVTYLTKVKSNHLARVVKIEDMKHNLSDSPSKKQIEKYTKGLEFLES